MLTYAMKCDAKLGDVLSEHSAPLRLPCKSCSSFSLGRAVGHAVLGSLGTTCSPSTCGSVSRTTCASVAFRTSSSGGYRPARSPSYLLRSPVRASAGHAIDPGGLPRYGIRFILPASLGCGLVINARCCVATSVSTFVAVWPGHAFFDWCRSSWRTHGLRGLGNWPGAAGSESTRAQVRHPRGARALVFYRCSVNRLHRQALQCVAQAPFPIVRHER